MVDHMFLFTSAVKKMRHLLEEGALGKLLITGPKVAHFAAQNRVTRAP
jgi:predicted dehydrogenase